MTASSIDRVARQDLSNLLKRHPLPELRGMRILITGGTGFLGRWLLTAIAQLNEVGNALEVVLTTRDPDRARRTIPWLDNATWASLVACDLSRDTLPHGRFDAVIHGAADTSASAASHPVTLLESIVEGSRKVLRRAANDQCRHVLMISSGAVYLPQEPGRRSLCEDAPCGGNPQYGANAYGLGKCAMEALAIAHADTFGLPVAIARCFAFVGGGLPLNAHFAIGNFIRDALAGGPIVVAGSGTAIRSYLYAADLAVWLLSILVRAPARAVYNVGSDQPIHIGALATSVRDLLAPEAQVVIEDRTRSEARPCYLPSIHVARRELGLDVWTPLETAIRRTAEAAAAQRAPWASLSQDRGTSCPGQTPSPDA
ncbi:MAG: NAD(P)-dependent oxidoreductase [Rhodocyclaceae bacterium]|nr:NAD(P)-dependent oxidoreductase [Rhodocyclaceae bacterium]